MLRLCSRAINRSSRTATAPTGTSPSAAVCTASSIATVIQKFRFSSVIVTIVHHAAPLLLHHLAQRTVILEQTVGRELGFAFLNLSRIRTVEMDQIKVPDTTDNCLGTKDLLQFFVALIGVGMADKGPVCSGHTRSFAACGLPLSRTLRTGKDKTRAESEKRATEKEKANDPAKRSKKLARISQEVRKKTALGGKKFLCHNNLKPRR